MLLVLVIHTLVSAYELIYHEQADQCATYQHLRISAIYKSNVIRHVLAAVNLKTSKS